MPRGLVVWATVAVVLAGLALGAIRLYALSRDFADARSSVNAALSAAQAVGFGLSSGDVATIDGSLASADASLAKAQDQLRHDPLLRVLGALPVTGPQVSALTVMV